MSSTTAANLQTFLDRLTSRSVLTRAEQEAILGLPSHELQVRANTDFVRLGERLDHVCFVAAGLAGRFDQNALGQRQITALHIPGDMADLHSVVQPTATSALQALSPTAILRIPHGAIRGIAGRYPAIAEALWRDCMVDAMILGQWVVNVGRRSGRSRIAHVLCELAVRYGAVSNETGMRFNLRMSQTHLGDATGLTPVHVNRCLQALRDEGLTWRGGVVRIDDWQRLAAVGDFDDAYLQLDIRPEQRIRIVQ